MRFFILLTFSLFITGQSIAQDTIVKNNADLIQAKIIEITSTQLKYKKFNFQDGPTYIENKSDIRYVKYANGLKEEFSSDGPKIVEPTVIGGTDYYDPNAGRAFHTNKMETIGAVKYRYDGKRIGERTMQGILMKTKDEEIVKNIHASQNAHLLQFLGFGAIPLGIAALVTLGSSTSYNGTMNSGALAGGMLLLGGAIACPIVGGIFKHKRLASNSKAVELYNQRY